MNNLICYIEENHEFFDFLIKLLAFLVAMCSAAFALWTYNNIARKTKYEFFRDLNEDFLNDRILKKRAKVSSFWEKRFLKTQDNIRLHEVPELANLDDDKIKDYLSTHLGMTFIDINEEFVKDPQNALYIKETEHILNKYEHFAKLVDAKVIHKKEIKRFFYTMFADTFVICLPFILYRRKSKPAYAHKMQALLKIFPSLSRTLTRV